MGIPIGLIIFAAISFVFAKGAKRLWRYYKQLLDTQSGIGAAYFEKFPRWHACMRFGLPVVVAGFWFNAIGAALAFLYIVVKFAHGYL